MSYFISPTVTIEEGIRITARATAGRGLMFLWCLGTDIPDRLQFTTWTWALGRAKELFLVFWGLSTPYSTYFHTYGNAWKQRLCFLGYRPGLPWWIPDCTYIQIKFLVYKIYFCDQSFQPSFTALSNNENLYSWVFPYPVTFGTAGHHSLPCSCVKPVSLHHYQNRRTLP